MGYIRLTKEASLIEISRDYMRASKEINFYDMLDRVLLLFSPIGVKITGETRSGGFESRFIVIPVDESDIFKCLISVIKAYARTKQVGYLAMDGIVKSIQEPYKRFFVQLFPLKRRFKYIRMRTTHHFTTLYIEGDKITEVYEMLLKNEAKPLKIVKRLHHLIDPPITPPPYIVSDEFHVKKLVIYTRLPLPYISKYYRAYETYKIIEYKIKSFHTKPLKMIYGLTEEGIEMIKQAIKEFYGW